MIYSICRTIEERNFDVLCLRLWEFVRVNVWVNLKAKPREPLIFQGIAAQNIIAIRSQRRPPRSAVQQALIVPYKTQTTLEPLVPVFFLLSHFVLI